MGNEQQSRSPERAQNLILEGRRRLHVSGVTEVRSFHEQEVVCDTVLGELTVRGEELHVEQLAVESGELSLSGHVEALFYREAAAGLRRRLFG